MVATKKHTTRLLQIVLCAAMLLGVSLYSATPSVLAQGDEKDKTADEEKDKEKENPLDSSKQKEKEGPCGKDYRQVTVGFPGAEEKGDGVYCVKTGGDNINENPIFILFKGIIQVLSIGVGVLVTGGIIYGGIMYASARGNSGQVEEAKNIIRNAVIGLLLFIFMVAFLNFLIPGGIFG